MKEKYPVICPNRAPVGYWRRYLNWSLVGTEVARVTPSAETMSPRLAVYSFTTGSPVERVGVQGRGVDDLQPVELDEQGDEQHDDARGRRAGSAGSCRHPDDGAGRRRCSRWRCLGVM